MSDEFKTLMPLLLCAALAGCNGDEKEACGKHGLTIADAIYLNKAGKDLTVCYSPTTREMYVLDMRSGEILPGPKTEEERDE